MPSWFCLCCIAEILPRKFEQSFLNLSWVAAYVGKVGDFLNEGERGWNQQSKANWQADM
jgi:hypothetical protein